MTRIALVATIALSLTAGALPAPAAEFFDPFCTLSTEDNRPGIQVIYKTYLQPTTEAQLLGTAIRRVTIAATPTTEAIVINSPASVTGFLDGTTLRLGYTIYQALGPRFLNITSLLAAGNETVGTTCDLSGNCLPVSLTPVPCF